MTKQRYYIFFILCQSNPLYISRMPFKSYLDFFFEIKNYLIFFGIILFGGNCLDGNFTRSFRKISVVMNMGLCSLFVGGVGMFSVEKMHSLFKKIFVFVSQGQKGWVWLELVVSDLVELLVDLLMRIKK